MPSLPDEEFERICVRVFKSDYDYVKKMAETAPGDISANLIIRMVLHNYVTQIKAGERQRIDQLVTSEPQREEESCPIRECTNSLI